DSVLREPLPEPYSVNRELLPDETFVLVGFYKSAEHLEWITDNGLYNFRTGTKNGSIPIDMDLVRSKYLLLHTFGDQNSGELWKINGDGYKIYSKQDLIKKGYPSDN